jgi:hypothetical protein
MLVSGIIFETSSISWFAFQPQCLPIGFRSSRTRATELAGPPAGKAFSVFGRDETPHAVTACLKVSKPQTAHANTDSQQLYC